MSDLMLNRRVTQFLAIYEAGSLHRASERLGVTQPALTASLRKLEAEIGVPLFERTVGGMVPTACAHVLHRYGIALRQGGRMALDEMRGLSDGVTGRLRIGAGVAWTTTILPPILEALHARFPGLAIDLIADVGDRLAARLVAGELDVVMAGGVIPTLASPDFARDYLTNLPMVAVADPDSTLAMKSAVTAVDLAHADWVGFYEDENIVTSANAWMAERGLPPPRFTMRTNSPTALGAFVRGTEFVSVLIAPLARSTQARGLMELPLKEPLWSLPMNLHYRTIASGSPPVAAFCTHAREVVYAAQ